jgi:hypothetical protein
MVATDVEGGASEISLRATWIGCRFGVGLRGGEVGGVGLGGLGAFAATAVAMARVFISAPVYGFTVMGVNDSTEDSAQQENILIY